MNKKYYFILFFLGVLALIFAGCGGGDGYTGPQPTPTPSTITKSVSGYVYYTSTISDSGENIEKICILDEPPSSILSYLTEDPNSLNTADEQELYNQLSSDISGWKPLLEKYPGAKLFSVYQDSKSETPIPVSTDGHFEGTVSVKTTDATVKFQVFIDDNKYIQAESIASSDITSSSQTTGELKSCPERIFALPEECVVFEVFSTPSVNLKNAGLSFTINNPSLGCVTQPFYEKVCNKTNYNVAYGIFYAKKGLTTPVDTTITAKTNTGLTLNIFTEVIKSTASISGKVNGGLGATPSFGFVISDGPCALDLLSASGNYSLSKVFKGHYRDVLAVWWVNEGGKCVRHWELKTIEFFNGNLSDFNFGASLLPTPTPTHRPPWDRFYDIKVSNVIFQYKQWKTELGTTAAIQKTVDWLNRVVTDLPVPAEIVESVIDENNDTAIWIGFADGHRVKLECESTFPIETNEKTTALNTQNYKTSSPSMTSSNATTVGSRDMLILAPFVWQEEAENLTSEPYEYRVYGPEIAGYLHDNGYTVIKKWTKKSDFDDDPNQIYPHPSPPPEDPNAQVMPVYLHDPNNPDIVRPEDFLDMGKYGIIYIATHGNVDNLVCGLSFENDNLTQKSLTDNIEFKNRENRIWYYGYGKFRPDGYYSKILCLKTTFFNQTSMPSSFFIKDSIVLLASCYSHSDMDRPSQFSIRDTSVFSDAKVFLGYNRENIYYWSRPVEYYLFYYLIHGFTVPVAVPNRTPQPTPTVLPEGPMSVKEAYDLLKQQKVNPDPKFYGMHLVIPYQDCTLVMETQNHANDNTYFPAPINIIVNKK